MASDDLRLLAVLAHPDDESLGLGGTFAHYAAEGVETALITATPGDRGRFFDNERRPSDEEVGRVRAGELHAAARELGIRRVELLGYRDGELDRVPPAEAVPRIAALIRQIRPHVVITFGPDGVYGHPDHIAISQLTGGSIVAAADPSLDTGAPPHAVAKLYHMGWPVRIWEIYQRAFKRLVSVVDGVEREANAWQEWALTTRIDAREHWPTVWRAILMHRTQMAVYQRLHELSPDEHAVLWGDQHFCRVFSTVNGGRARETDLFEGLR